MARVGGRDNRALREVRITTPYLQLNEASVLIEMGLTKVLCVATLEERVPPFLKNSGRGWVTAEYAMLPASTQTRSPRESVTGKLGGRTHEIQRLIGRSLRAVTDLTGWGERTVTIDCDVLQADGGTRTASITGAFIALAVLFKALHGRGVVDHLPLKDYVSAVSVGIVDGIPLLDLDYREDSRAEVDMNVVMTGKGQMVEIQGTAEGHPFDRSQLLELIELAERGNGELVGKIRATAGGIP